MSTTRYTVACAVEKSLRENLGIGGEIVEGENGAISPNGSILVKLDDNPYLITVAKMVPNCGDTMTFGQAIDCLKRGFKVAREGWNGKGMYLWLLPAADVKRDWCRDPRLLEAMGDRDVLPCLGSIRMFTATKEVLTGWLASQTDMLAEDWVVVGF